MDLPTPHERCCFENQGSGLGHFGALRGEALFAIEIPGVVGKPALREDRLMEAWVRDGITGHQRTNGA